MTDPQDGLGPSVCLAAVADNQVALVQMAIEGKQLAIDDFFEWELPGAKGSSARRTLSQVAAFHGCLEVLEYLISQGASPNIASPSDGATPLHCACEGASPQCQEVIQILLDAGADKEATDQQGRRPVDLLLKSVKAPQQSPDPPSCGEHVPRQEGQVSELDKPEYATDESRIYVYKVVDCPITEAHDWTECPYAHPGEKARRRNPDTHQYTGLACPDFRKGTCKRGDICPFAHGVFENWLHPSRYRTQLCKDAPNCTRRVCFFAHQLEELRTPDKADLDLLEYATAISPSNENIAPCDGASPAGSASTPPGDASSHPTSLPPCPSTINPRVQALLAAIAADHAANSPRQPNSTCSSGGGGKGSSGKGGGSSSSAASIPARLMRGSTGSLPGLEASTHLLPGACTTAYGSLDLEGPLVGSGKGHSMWDQVGAMAAAASAASAAMRNGKSNYRMNGSNASTAASLGHSATDRLYTSMQQQAQSHAQQQMMSSYATAAAAAAAAAATAHLQQWQQHAATAAAVHAAAIEQQQQLAAAAAAARSFPMSELGSFPGAAAAYASLPGSAAAAMVQDPQQQLQHHMALMSLHQQAAVVDAFYPGAAGSAASSLPLMLAGSAPAELQAVSLGMSSHLGARTPSAGPASLLMGGHLDALNHGMGGLPPVGPHSLLPASMGFSQQQEAQRLGSLSLGDLSVSSALTLGSEASSLLSELMFHQHDASSVVPLEDWMPLQVGA